MSFSVIDKQKERVGVDITPPAVGERLLIQNVRKTLAKVQIVFSSLCFLDGQEFLFRGLMFFTLHFIDAAFQVAELVS